MKTLLSVIVTVMVIAPVMSQDTPPPVEEPAAEEETRAEEPAVEEMAPPEARLGRIYFPRPIIHAGETYPRGVYVVTLTSKDGHPYFRIYNRNQELLFDEMAVVLPYEAKNKNFKYRVRRAMLRGYEYFRIKVIQPNKLVMGYFKVNQPQTTGAQPSESGEEERDTQEKQEADQDG